MLYHPEFNVLFADVSNPGVNVLFMDVSNPVSRSRIARGLVRYTQGEFLMFSISPIYTSPVPILVTAPELQEDWLGTKDEIGSSNVTYIT